MATIEPMTFIREKEYNDYRSDRLHENELEQNQLCTFFTQFEPGEKEAARIPVRLTHMEHAIGALSITVCLLDADLGPLFEADGKMNNGFWKDNAGTIRVKGLSSKEQLATEAFLHEYDDGLSLDQLTALYERALPVSV